MNFPQLKLFRSRNGRSKYKITLRITILLIFQFMVVEDETVYVGVLRVSDSGRPLPFRLNCGKLLLAVSTVFNIPRARKYIYKKSES